MKKADGYARFLIRPEFAHALDEEFAFPGNALHTRRTLGKIILGAARAYTLFHALDRMGYEPPGFPESHISRVWLEFGSANKTVATPPVLEEVRLASYVRYVRVADNAPENMVTVRMGDPHECEDEGQLEEYSLSTERGIVIARSAIAMAAERFYDQVYAASRIRTTEDH